MFRQFSYLLIALNFVGCTAQEILEPRPANVPLGVDLSGNWQIRREGSDSPRRLQEAIRQTDGVRDRDMFRLPDSQSSATQSRRSNGRVKGGLVFVFLEMGESLKVTQTADGLFISFDRAIVEEFRFGENRMISVGEVEAQRVTGWEGNELVVETLDRNRMKMTERFGLAEGGKVLRREITLRSKEGEEEVVLQLFDRSD
jgi:hypothetical protein